MALTFDRIATTTLGTATNTITFGSITQSYTDLRIVLVGSSTGSTRTATIRLNNNTTNIYGYNQMYNTTSSISYLEFLGAANIQMGVMTPTTPSMFEIDVMGYSRTNINKSVLVKGSVNGTPTGVTTGRNVISAGCFGSTGAVTQIDLVLLIDSFSVGTIATLYGIARA